MIAMLLGLPARIKLWAGAILFGLLVLFGMMRAAEQRGRARAQADAMRREIQRRNRQSEKVNEIEGAIEHATSSSPAAHHDLLDRLRNLGL